MGKKDIRIDQYIAKSADFAKPILIRFRELVHQACPEVEEGMKWNSPHFEYKGMLCGMASFKNHCAIGFWKESLVLGSESKRNGMGHFGRLTSMSDLPSDKRLLQYIRKAAQLNDEGVKVKRPPRKSTPELPTPEDLQAALRKNKKALTVFQKFSPSHRREYIRKAAQLNDEGVKVKRPPRKSTPEPPTPDDLQAALRKNKKALAAFQRFSPSHRREYIEWITEAKTDATRSRRLATAIEWMAEAKPRNWKYM